MKKGLKIFLWVLFFLLCGPIALVVFLAYYFAKQNDEKKRDAAKEKFKNEKEISKEDGAVYVVNGARGRSLRVYDDKCIISVKAGVGSFVTGNATDGEKTIYYVDCVGVQFKKSGATLGYLQLETASSAGNSQKNNFFNENTFTYEPTQVSNDDMEEVASFVKKKVDEAKKQRGGTVVTQLSSADELKKFKELLDAGIITQEEFEAKKKDLLKI